MIRHDHVRDLYIYYSEYVQQSQTFFCDIKVRVESYSQRRVYAKGQSKKMHMILNTTEPDCLLAGPTLV